MVRTLFITLFIMLMCSSTLQGAQQGAAGGDEPQPGVARELARWRAAHYRDVRYTLRVTLTRGAERLRGEVETRVTIDDATRDLVLDWRVLKQDGQEAARVWDIDANGRAAERARVVNEHIVIPREYLKIGENALRMKFESPVSTTGSAALTRYRDRTDDTEYIYTLFVPSDASTAFPCFDQPDLKARFRLDITVPDSWRVITNTTPESIWPGSERGTRRTRFHDTRPISTYVFAFAAGDFEELRDKSSTLGTRLYVRKSKTVQAWRESAEVFRLNREGVGYFTRYFNQKFPFPKYDLVLIPQFPFRGMEHAGATFLREDSILFPSDPTASDLLARADVILHEAAHQWFGDLVTMRWFDDLWLKEGFATFMAAKAIEEVLPQYDAWKVFYQRNKPLAYETDVTKGTTPIWQELPNLSAAKSAYGNIVYRKAPSVLRQSEFYLGPMQFQRAVQSFLKSHAFSNATWDDLVRAFEGASGRRLDRWADAWVKRRGMPKVTVSLNRAANGRVRSLTLGQQNVLGEGGAWPMRLKVLLVGKRGPTRAGEISKVLTVTLDGTGRPQVVPVVGMARVSYVFANYEDYGYGLFLPDEESRRYLMQNLGNVRDEFQRSLLWGALWDAVREAEMPPADYIELSIREVSRERDEVTVQSVLTRAALAFNRYLTDEQRREIAPRLESVVFKGATGAETAGLRITYLRGYQSIATTDEARANLKKVLRGEIQIPGMTLRSRDRFDIITALLARGDREASALLEEQSRQDASDDGRRYAYAAGAARPEKEVKQKYFGEYVNSRDLPESWIEASMVPFNFVGHSQMTLPYLEPALRQLPTLKRTRKIFFVNGWLAAFIGGQCNERALTTVHDFLSGDATFDRDLQLKVLEASDGLERCVRIRRKFNAGS